MSRIPNEFPDKLPVDNKVKRPVPDGKPVSRKHLVNSLNRINFQDGNLTFNFRNRQHGNQISLSAKPLPCFGEELKCLWCEEVRLPGEMKEYEFINFFFSDGLSRVQVDADILRMNNEGVHLSLPETAYDINIRKIRRHFCTGVKAQLSQGGLVVDGLLVYFSAVAFCVDISATPASSPPWIDPDMQIMVLLKNDQEIIYSGACESLRIVQGQGRQLVTLRPVARRIQRFKPKEVRSIRQKLLPLPNIIFRHPLTGKKIVLKAVDLSGSGISAEEDFCNSILLPGMIISGARIEFINGFAITCNRIQVLYRDIHDDGIMKCGLAILDMDVYDHVKLSSILYQAEDKNSNICTTNIDLDALWEFFFNAGFIYPEKYKFIKEHKEKYKELYKKLYTQNLSIARHIIYQDKGVIYGHVAMFRFYEKSWILHHHAATHSKYHRAGLIVMEHILRYINEFHNLHSAKMNYITCYFRPNNKFANRVFGGAAKEFNNPKMVSSDSFAYFHCRKAALHEVIPKDWDVAPTRKEDLAEMQSFYEQRSGGLMLNALDLEPELIDYDCEISKEYRDLGLKRERLLFSLKKKGILKAVFMVNVSDLGLNLSDLTNCIHAFVVDPKDLSREILFYALSLLFKYYEQKEISILLYPRDFADDRAIAVDKTYSLDILDLNYINQYLKFIEGLMHYSKRKVSKLPS